MYCVDDRSWRDGSATTRLRYSANDIARRLRVKTSRTAWPSSTSNSRTAVEPAGAEPAGAEPEGAEPAAAEPAAAEPAGPAGMRVSTITLTVSPRSLLRGHRDGDGLLLGEALV